MPVQSLRAKLARMASRRGKRQTSKKVAKKPKEQEPNSDLRRNGTSVNLFEKYPGFARLHVDRLVVDEDVEEEDMVQNEQIVLQAIRFFNGLQFVASRVNKERLMSKFNHNFPQTVIVDQLYCLLPNSSCETFVDKVMQRLVTKQKVKMIDLNNENFKFRLAILWEDFAKVVDSIEDKSTREAFLSLVKDYPNLLQIDQDLLDEYDLDASALIHQGFLTISREQADVYNIGLPNLGPFLKIVNVGIRFVTSTCLSFRQNQALEKDLLDKYNRDTLVYRRMRGLNLTWMLSVMVGSGLLECFNTGVGRVYRITGKKL